jgi:hypothetical protein
MPPKATFAQGPEGSIGQAGKESFLVSRRNHCRSKSASGCRPTTRMPTFMPRPLRLSAHKRAGSRIVNSVNSPTRLLTAIVPPCCWVTMSQAIDKPSPVPSPVG